MLQGLEGFPLPDNLSAASLRQFECLSPNDIVLLVVLECTKMGEPVFESMVGAQNSHTSQEVSKHVMQLQLQLQQHLATLCTGVNLLPIDIDCCGMYSLQHTLSVLCRGRLRAICSTAGRAA